jgi:MscS family membrane protein
MEFSRRPRSGFSQVIQGPLFFLAFLLAFVVGTCAQDARVSGAQVATQTSPEPYRIPAVQTDSPRDTMASFLHLRTNLEKTLISYREEKTRDKMEHLFALAEQLNSLIDLSTTPPASRYQVARETIAYLLDILGRVGAPNPDSIPDAETIAERKGVAKWQIPNTPIKIVRINEGSREGEFLFSERTIRSAPRFYNGIRDIPLRSGLGIASWRSTLLQASGPMIPAWLVDAIPDRLKATWQDTPIWKVLAVLLISGLAVLLIRLLHRFAAGKETDKRIVALVWRLLPPLWTLAAVMLLSSFFDFQLGLSGAFSRYIEFAVTAILHVAVAWLFWLGVRIFFEWLILSPHIPEESLDANLLRLLAAVVGIIGVTIILAIGGETLGVPALSLLAGLGIGGIAVALAVRPTLENLIGGAILYIDKPVRVGDFCSFGDKTGTVENIGVRSTQLRAQDRTLISVPNAQFADMQIVNWAKCDQMLIQETVGVRYETTPDQLRYLLAKLREMLHAHPRIDNDTIRVRFSGYGDSSLNITIRVYAKTREWNDFHAIREDVLLRTCDVVNEAGSGFAFPSRTVYMGKDDGLEKERSDMAEEQVETWRRSGRLPFPRLPADRIGEIEDTLDYPPRGSPEASGKEGLGPDDLDHPVAEPLSAAGDDQIKGKEGARKTEGS